MSTNDPSSKIIEDFLNRENDAGGTISALETEVKRLVKQIDELEPKKYKFQEDEFIHLLKGAIEIAFGYSKIQGKTEGDCANFAIGAVLGSLENKHG